MPRIFTHPDVDLNVNIPKVMISNADWDDVTIQELVNVLSEKEYDIYLLHAGVTDVQWEYGIKDKCKTKLDARDARGDGVAWLKTFDDEFEL